MGSSIIQEMKNNYMDTDEYTPTDHREIIDYFTLRVQSKSKLV